MNIFPELPQVLQAAVDIVETAGGLVHPLLKVTWMRGLEMPHHQYSCRDLSDTDVGAGVNIMELS